MFVKSKIHREKREKLEKKIAIAKHINGFVENAASLLFVFSVLCLILLYQIGFFKKSFERKLFVFLELTALSICVVTLCVSLVDLLYIKNKQKELEDAKSDDKEEKKGCNAGFRLKNVVPYTSVVASLFFVTGETLAVIALFSNFTFGVIPAKSKISFHSMIDIAALSILLIGSVCAAFSAIKDCSKEKGVSKKRDMVIAAVAVFTVLTTALSLAGRTIFALELTGNFSLTNSADGAFIPLGIPLRIAAMLLPFLVSAVSLCVLMSFGVQKESNGCMNCSGAEAIDGLHSSVKAGVGG